MSRYVTVVVMGPYISKWIQIVEVLSLYFVQPYVMYGAGGSGKSSMLSMTAFKVGNRKVFR